jgi:Bacterial PH domain
VQDLGQTASDKKPWKLADDGRTAFRLVSPIVIWWVWVVFAIVTLALVAIPGHNYFSAELAAGLAAVTAIVYATALRPSVFADDDGVHVQNPLRDHRIGWGGLSEVYLGDMVEFSCSRPAPRHDKTVYCWALYSSRRGRLRARMRTSSGPSLVFGFARAATAGAKEPSRPDTVELMAAELRRRSVAAREDGAPAAVLQSTWAWWPVAALVLPAAALLGLVLAR